MAWIDSLPLLVAQAANSPAVNEALDNGVSAGTAGMLKLLVAIAILAGSYGLGVLMARAIRLPEFSGKLGLIMLTILGSAAICYFGWPPKLGIDLSGGVVLVYEVEEAAKGSELREIADRVSAALNQDRAEKIDVTVGDDTIQVRLPAGANTSVVENTIAGLQSTGIHLSSAGRRDTAEQIVLVYEPTQKLQKVKMDELIGAINKRINPSGVKELVVRQYGTEAVEIIVPEVEQAEIEDIKERIRQQGALEFRILANPRKRDHVPVIERALASPDEEVVNITPEGRHVLAKWVEEGPEMRGEGGAISRPSPNGEGTQILVMMDPYNVTGQYLSRSSPGVDQSGRQSIDFSFDSTGAQLFGAFTAENVPDSAGVEQRLGIVLDNVLISAPTLQSQIREQGQITGQFQERFVNTVVDVLNAGSLPTALNKVPIQEQRISAQLGADTIRQGSYAMFYSSLGVVLFMLFYYRFAGVVADGAVLLNLLMAIAMMILIKAAFTLPGLAGLILTVGMAVDANVLIYERMREETQRGASLRMAIRNGYARAMSTIIDSNITTIATGVVLFAIGSDQIRGFAVTLILGLLASLYTAVYVSRVVFDIFEKKRWLTELRMRQWFKKTDFDFVGYMWPAAVLSTILIVGSLAAVVLRGKDILDIDFSGGTSVQVQFKKDHPQDTAQVRAAVADLPDVVVSAVGTDNLQYKIDTSEPKVDDVRPVLQKVFGDALLTYEMSYKDLRPYNPDVEEKTVPAGLPEADEKTGESDMPAPAGKGTEPAREPAEPAEKQPAVEAPSTEETPSSNEAPKTDEPATEEPAETPSEPTQEPAADGESTSEAAPADEPAAPPAAEEPQSARRQSGSSRPQELVLSVLLLGQNEGEAAAQDAPAQDAPAESGNNVAPEAASGGDDAAAAAGEGATGEEAAADAPAAADPATPADAAPANEAPIDVADPAEKAETGDTPVEEPAVAKPTAEITATEPAAPTVGTSADLNFPQAINHGTLRDRVKLELAELGQKDAFFEITNSRYVPGSELRFNDWTLNIMLPEAETVKLLDGIKDRLASEPVFPAASEIGGQVAGRTRLSAVYAILASLVVIVLYVWVRFQNVVFGFASVLALVHDVIVALGAIAVSYWLAVLPGTEWLLIDPFKISLAVVAAFLTIVGFSINDTIVIFDRMREIRGKSPELTAKMVNQAINETLSRTFITSGTVFIATLILYAVGGEGIHPFAFTMLIGVISGTYSTVFIAAPLVLYLKPPADTVTTNNDRNQQRAGSNR